MGIFHPSATSFRTFKILGVLSVVATSGSMYMQFKLEEKLANQEFCNEAINILMNHDGALKLLGTPVTHTRPVYSNTFNRVSLLKVDVAIPVIGTKARGNLLVTAAREKAEQPLTIQDLKFSFKNNPEKLLKVYEYQNTAKDTNKIECISSVSTGDVIKNVKKS